MTLSVSPSEKRQLSPHPHWPRQGQKGQLCCSTNATHPPDPMSAREPPVTLNAASVARLLVKSPCVVAPVSSEVQIQGLHSCQPGSPRPHRQPLLPEQSFLRCWGWLSTHYLSPSFLPGPPPARLLGNADRVSEQQDIEGHTSQ